MPENLKQIRFEQRGQITLSKTWLARIGAKPGAKLEWRLLRNGFTAKYAFPGSQFAGPELLHVSQAPVGFQRTGSSMLSTITNPQGWRSEPHH